MDKSTEIKALREKANRLEKEQKVYNLLPNEIKLAEAIHDKVCRWNHTDGCSWNYEKWDGSTPSGSTTKDRYLEKAKKILKVVDFETAIDVINNL